MPCRENEIATAVVQAAIRIHEALGPGLLESVYESCLEAELHKKGFQVRRQQPIPVVYDGEKLEDGFRADLLVDGLVIVEIKSVEALAPVHFKTVLSYLRLSSKKLGILINFNEALVKDGIKRIVNGLAE